jgi:pyruvate/2-oxoglutarate dehydrogenase complex dihydrolipoamide dehydrogenase (E3) component
MASYDYDLGVIGAGAAGLTVASGAAQMGAKTLLVERREHLGGDCLHYGCVPSKTLIRSARVYHTMRQGPRFGLPAVDPGPVDFARVRERIRSVIATIQPHDSPERFCSLGAAVEFAEARFVDEHQVRLDGRTVSAGKWVVATGSRPHLPPVPGLAEAEPLTNETLFSMDALPADMIVLGGGPIAVELSQALQRLGCRVTLLQRSTHLLVREDPAMADKVRAVLEEEGVAVHTGMALKRVRRERGARVVTVEDAEGREREFRAAALFAALGRRVNTDTLDLENAGLETSPSGLEVDDRMRTTQQHILACGDVTGKYQFTHAAGYEGGIVLANAVFHLPRKVDYTWLPRVTYTDPELAAVGLTPALCEERGIEHQVWKEEFAANDRALAEGAERGLLQLVLDKREKPLGVQILGPHAGELLGEWSAVLAGKVRLSTLAGAVHAYPTLAEINKKVAGSVMAPKLFSGIVQKTVSTLFRFQGRACEWPFGPEDTGDGHGG